MVILFLLTSTALSLNISFIPSTGTPPDTLSGSAAVYDEKTNSIITIGGEKISDSQVVSSVYIFDLTNNLWSSPRIISEYKPSGMRRHRAYLRKDRKILILGVFKEILLFDLEDYSWSYENLKGDQIPGLFSFGMASFKEGDEEFLAIFGGSSQYSYSDSLFLVEVNSLTSRLLPNLGTAPSARIDPTLVYYEGCLYMYGYSTYNLILGVENGSELYRYNLSSYYWEILETTGNLPGPKNSHFAYVFNHQMFIIFGMLPEILTFDPRIFKFHFNSGSWEYVNFFGSEFRIMSGNVMVGSKVYLFYGPGTNSVISVDLSLDPLRFEIVSKQWEAPSARLYHACFTSNEHLYVFGGSTSTNMDLVDYFNDMWEFNIETETWTSLDVTGSIPSPRSNFAYTILGDELFFIFGGKGYEGYLDDLYYFHIPTKNWYSFGKNGNWPSARSHSCMSNAIIGLIIVGGRYEKTGFSDIWFFYFDQASFTLMYNNVYWNSENNETFNTLIDPTCWMSQNSSNMVLNIAGGYDILQSPNFNLIQVTFTNVSILVNVQPFGVKAYQEIFGAETSTFVSGNNLIRVGGSIFSWIILQNIMIYNFESKSTKIIDTRYQIGLYGHTAVHYKKSIYIFGGGKSIEIYRSDTDISKNFMKVDLSDYLNCSQGTFGKSCELCPTGTFGNNSKCTECPAGTYNDKRGSSILSQCLPCPFGTFSSKKGSRFCLDCEKGFYCPIGSTAPMKYYQLPQNESYQPSSMTYQDDFVSDFTVKSWIFAGIFTGFVVIVCVFFHAVWIKLKIVDVFSSNHGVDLGVPVTYRKTSIGGMFSLIFVIVAGVTILVSFLSFQLDNISELKALIPVISLENEIVSELVSIKTVLFTYGGDCIHSKYKENVCHEYIHITEEGIIYSSRFVTCFKTTESCKIFINYYNFQLSLKNSFVLISFEEFQSFAGAISVNISSSSSIPGEISGLNTVIGTGSDQNVFKGSVPSEFFFKFIPSVFKSDSTKWPSKETGFHIYSHQNTNLGSLSSQDNLNLQINVKVKISISQSETAMQTLRILNQTWIVFIGSLLGSIFGIMGSIAGLMKMIEGFMERYEKKKWGKEQLENKLWKSIDLQNQISPKNSFKKRSKIVPVVYEIKETFCDK